MNIRFHVYVVISYLYRITGLLESGHVSMTFLVTNFTILKQVYKKPVCRLQVCKIRELKKINKTNNVGMVQKIKGWLYIGRIVLVERTEVEPFDRIAGIEWNAVKLYRIC